MSAPPLAVVTFLWSKPGYRSTFNREHVRTMARMVDRCYAGPHKFICFTDHGPHHVSDGVDWRPLWEDYAEVPSPHGAHNPACYRRLKLYSAWARETIGPRIVSIDLDMVITGSLNPIWDRPEPFVFWQDQLNRHGRINGAMQLITPGLRADVWDKFDPEEAKRVSQRPGFWGSDQGWIAHCIPPTDHGTWGAADGCYSWRVHCKPANGALPPGARVVNWHGHESPWDTPEPPAWVTEHYR